ncbi:MAG: iron-containing alcohol dehydrogenase [Oscillospiraceae bacterium]|jgi:alcohol dehydrogenase|nr:iron-containing alcohol dehydrogenase [Oscillospiraceae bacterium]
MKWTYIQPVEIIFETGGVKRLSALLESRGLTKGVLVCDPFFAGSGLLEAVLSYAGGKLAAVYASVTPNPRIEEADACAALLRETGADFAVALGGGSAMDCAKAACAAALSGGPIVGYHTGGKKLSGAAVPLIAIPTTAGTGSEVTCVAVLSDEAQGVKAPIADNSMYARLALIDPELTLSVPPRVTAATGLDVLSHALEAFWSRNHQPICDALALRAAVLVFENLQRAFEDGDDIDAREKMCEASVIAGLAFTLPKTAASHACSYPLTNLYGLPHGEACAFTLDLLCAVNAEAENGRLNAFARQLGFGGARQMGAEITRLKKLTGMRVTLADAGIDEADLPALAEKCRHPNLLNNPVPLDDALLIALFRRTKSL